MRIKKIMNDKIKLVGFQEVACNAIESLTEEMAAQLPQEWPTSKAGVLDALIEAGMKKGKDTNEAASTVWDLAPASNASATASVSVSATLAQPTEPENPWLAKVGGLQGDSRLTAYASAGALSDDDRRVLSRIGQIQAMALLDQSGLRAAIIAIAQLTADGKSKRKMPTNLADRIYKWWRLVSRNDSSIMSAEERAKFAVEVANLVHPDLEAMVNVAVIAKSGRTNMRAMGAGATFNVGSFGNLGPDEVSAQLPDVERLAVSKAQTSFVLQEYAVFAEEYERHLYPIVESAEFQALCGIQPGSDPRTTVAPALEQAGYPLAGAAFRAAVDTEKLWQFLMMCPDGGDEQYTLALGEIGTAVVRDNAQVARVIKSMEDQEVVAGVEANASNFRSSDDRVKAIALPRPPKGLQIFGWRLLVTAEAGVRLDRS